MLEVYFKAVTSITMVQNCTISSDDANSAKKIIYNQNKRDKKGYHGYLRTLCL